MLGLVALWGCAPAKVAVSENVEDSAYDIIDRDGDGSPEEDDCDDSNENISPSAVEICDGRDNNCDGEIDEGDVCPCEYFSFEGKGYFFCDWELAWEEAVVACEETRPSYSLVTINDEPENLWLYEQIVLIAPNVRWWIGFNDREEEGDFQWLDGAEVTYTSWQNGEPNDSGGEDCVELNRFDSTNWNDVTCDAANYLVCEGPR